MNHPHDPIARTPDGQLDPTLPEPVRRFLEAGARLERIRLDRWGRWWHQGEPFEHPRLIQLFNSSVDRTEGGTWVVRIGRFTYPIEVEDTGLFVRHIALLGDPTAPDAIDLHLTSGEIERLDPASLRHDALGVTCDARSGRLRARLLKAAYYKLTDLIDDDGDGDGFRLRLGGASTPIPPAQTDDPTL